MGPTEKLIVSLWSWVGMLSTQLLSDMGQGTSWLQPYYISYKEENKLGTREMGGWASQKAKAHQVGPTDKLSLSLWKWAETDKPHDTGQQ